jgi:transcriptional regulator NrdR family protein
VIVPASAAAAFCLQCAYRFTTYEQIGRSDRVICATAPMNHSIAASMNSLAKACEKRSINLVTLETAVDEIVHELGDR